MVERQQFRVLYREFLFRIVDLEVLSAHAQGDSRVLLGQFASLLIYLSIILALAGGLWAMNVRNDRVPALVQLIGGWTAAHFLIATTMLVVGLFAVLSQDSTFPDRRDVLVLGALPVRARTIFLAKLAAVASALGVAVLALHAFAGLAWPFALAEDSSVPAPALVFDPQMPPVHADEFPAVLNKDIQPMLPHLDLAAGDGKAGIIIGVTEHGVRRVMTYGAAKRDDLFEIGSITKTFTGLLLAQMALDGKVDLRDPVRELLPERTVARPPGFEITLVDLATHHSGLRLMPDNAGPGDQADSYTNYHTADLYDFIKRHGAERPANAKYMYSNVGFALLGTALANRAGIAYEDLLRRNITGPLGLNDTAISLSPEQLRRLMQGHDTRGQPTPRWDLDAFASAGGIRSTAGDMLTYLEAELNPAKTSFGAAIVESQRCRARVEGDVCIALAWEYNPAAGVYQHGGATGGFTSFAFFDRRHDLAAVGVINARPMAFPFITVLAEHVRERLRGDPALSLAPVSVAAAGPIRSFAAYWITMVAAGVFIFCAVLGLQGVAAQLLPRRWFLRISSFLQLGMFALLVSAYFLQRSPLTVLITGPQWTWMSWIPSYWFAGLYQQLNGSLHPALAPYALRAWIGLAAALCITAAAYAASYLRTLRKIVEEPDIAPALRSGWLPRFGGFFETAIVHFSIRTLLRSRQHRMIFAFYLGAAFAFAIVALNLPSELTGPDGTGPWATLSVPLLASSILLMGLWVVGARVVFALPLDVRANWIFRETPSLSARRCRNGWRRALFVLAVAPALTITAAVLFSIWPWRPAAAHLAALALLGVVLAEWSFEDVQKIPFACSYLPGKSHFHMGFLLWMYAIVGFVIETAVGESKALQSATGTAMVLGGLAIAALIAVLRSNWQARDGEAEVRFEEEPSDRLVTLNL